MIFFFSSLPKAHFRSILSMSGAFKPACMSEEGEGMGFCSTETYVHMVYTCKALTPIRSNSIFRTSTSNTEFLRGAFRATPSAASIFPQDNLPYYYNPANFFPLRIAPWKEPCPVPNPRLGRILLWAPVCCPANFHKFQNGICSTGPLTLESRPKIHRHQFLPSSLTY